MMSKDDRDRFTCYECGEEFEYGDSLKGVSEATLEIVNGSKMIVPDAYDYYHEECWNMD